MATVSTVSGNTYKPGYLSYVYPTGRTWYTTYLTQTGSVASHNVKTLNVVTHIEVIPLIFQQSDLDVAAKATTSVDAKETKAEATGTEAKETEGSSTWETTTQETSSDATNAADSAAPALSVRGVVPVVTVLVGMLAGAGIFAPW